jgi:hypothetical protein
MRSPPKPRTQASWSRVRPERHADNEPVSWNKIATVILSASDNALYLGVWIAYIDGLLDKHSC